MNGNASSNVCAKPGVELSEDFIARLVAPAVVASKIVTRLVVGDVEHGRTYSYREL